MTDCPQCQIVSAELSFCADHHRYSLNGKRLWGVTSVIKDVLPPQYDKVPPETLEYARERGIIVDALVTDYVLGKEPMIPVGSPNDPDLHAESTELFWKFAEWWNKQGFRNVEAQAIVHDDEVAGMLDLRVDGVVYDLKTVSKLMPSHFLQVGAYIRLGRNEGRATEGQLIHLTKRFKAPKIVPVPLDWVVDWETVRDFWRLKRRLSA